MDQWDFALRSRLDPDSLDGWFRTSHPHVRELHEKSLAVTETLQFKHCYKSRLPDFTIQALLQIKLSGHWRVLCNALSSACLCQLLQPGPQAFVSVPGPRLWFSSIRPQTHPFFSCTVTWAPGAISLSLPGLPYNYNFCFGLQVCYLKICQWVRGVRVS